MRLPWTKKEEPAPPRRVRLTNPQAVTLCLTALDEVLGELGAQGAVGDQAVLRVSPGLARTGGLVALEAYTPLLRAGVTLSVAIDFAMPRGHWSVILGSVEVATREP